MNKLYSYFFPALAILIIASSYYIYVVPFCVYQIKSLQEGLQYLLFLNLLFAMFLWSFLATTCTPIARVPLEYHLTDQETNNYLATTDEQSRAVMLQNIVNRKNLIVLMRTPYGGIRYCIFCKLIKPDRAHHCSVCTVCVLKMDHHCGWVNNCIGFSNHKNFVLMLVYCNAYCVYFMATTIKYVLLYYQYPEERYVVIVVGFIIVVSVMVAALSFLLFHCGVLFKNESTVEKVQLVMLAQENGSYNLGWRKNFIEEFGNNWKVWLFPVFSAVGNGTVFPVVFRQT